ncbi:phage tail sheath family protein [Exilibacterium tricleocarpae]|uniref:Phage tail sheath family protein n=1 Tax=Exilibacterium tricleocarpae TaxID=2591008 RepID=A0A545TZ40_9GAMM|nr:phage tail sheath C-terminal domain-containing protein [Exilibacterium tricleocarpae]TQV82490.1 phage tail sheath family protein [Exilibacterium tricleocarpae]
MPVTPTYPGVYIEEIPSGVRTITGVATSITAFIGRARRGPVNEAKIINSFGDYERLFGGLDLDSSMSYAVRDFYLNGGSQAVIVRLYHTDTSEGAAPAKTSFAVGGAALEAAYEGAWGAYLRAEVDLETSAEVAAGLGLDQADLFNLTVRDVGPGGDTETFLNLSFKNSLRRVDKVLESSSSLVRWDGVYPEGSPPTPAAEKDAVTLAEEALKAALEADPDADTSAEEAALQAAKLTLVASNGSSLDVNDFTGPGFETTKQGLYALEDVDLFNLLCLPPYSGVDAAGNPADIDKSLVAKANAYCEKRRALLLVDARSDWTDKDSAKQGITAGVGAVSKNAAVFFPRLKQPNPLRDNQVEAFVPCGAVAGIMSRTDTQRGVWKAPAGIEATLRGVPELTVKLTDAENGELNPLGVNCLRSFPVIGRVVWGSRTLRGADILADDYKYIPVRRLALFIEESLFRGTQWVVFEPNDEPLWAQIRLNIGAFMHNLFRQGAFQGTTPSQAYFVKCDKETTTQNDIDRGIVNIVVGFAPLKPAEFVIIKIQQIAGELEV